MKSPRHGALSTGPAGFIRRSSVARALHARAGWRAGDRYGETVDCSRNCITIARWVRV